MNRSIDDVTSFVELVIPCGEARLDVSGVGNRCWIHDGCVAVRHSAMFRFVQVHRGETYCYYSLRRGLRKLAELFLTFKGAQRMKCVLTGTYLLAYTACARSSSRWCTKLPTVTNSILFQPTML